MRRERIQWNIRHVLKDGTVLKPGEKLPITEASAEAFRQYAEIAQEAAARRRMEQEAAGEATA